ncbi:MAG: LysM peptidoglycan-binding domain-containing protein [Lachnospiraceae bacterium]|nr:LysM peptidoglycan-binding domain-containing protein [Lachnospiraceae bacterium]
METTDIVIHKGEKDKKYQLYVEDYVMSYLKNYASSNERKIFFYGTREQKNKKYYIYGAGPQRDISYFVRYELLDEIVCRFDMNMPVFSIKEDSKRYQLSGYYIFYQSNEAMQSYMIEQNKENGSVEKEQDKFKSQSQSMTIRPQDFSDIRMRGGMKKPDEEQEKVVDNKVNRKRTSIRHEEQGTDKMKGGVMALQLCAVFLVLAAIIINSTNSYPKLKELGQSAVEVFFAMENQDASQRAENEVSDAADETETSGGTVLRLEDLDAELEKENRAAANEDADDKDDSKTENVDGTDNDSENEGNENSKDSNDNEISASEDNGEENSTNENKDNKDGDDIDEINRGSEDEENTNDSEEGSKAAENSNATPDSQEAFARNLTEYYKIEKGDTLCDISIRKYGDASKVKEICEINKIEDPDNIKYGQKIILP